MQGQTVDTFPLKIQYLFKMPVGGCRVWAPKTRAESESKIKPEVHSLLYIVLNHPTSNP